MPSSLRLCVQSTRTKRQLIWKSVPEARQYHSPLVADGVEDLDLIENGAVVQGDGQGVTDRSGLGVVVVGREELILHALHLCYTVDRTSVL